MIALIEYETSFHGHREGTSSNACCCIFIRGVQVIEVSPNKSIMAKLVIDKTTTYFLLCKRRARHV